MRRDSSRYGNFPKRQKSRERPWNRASPAFGKLWEHAGKCRVDLFLVLPTNLPAVSANEMRIDNVFLLEDDTVAIVDYESEDKASNRVKYINYIGRIMHRYDSQNKVIPKLRMIVIYTGDVEHAEDTWEIPCLTLKMEQVFIHSLPDAEIYQSIKKKLENNETLSDKELMQLIILPLAKKGKEVKQKVIEQVVDLAKQIEDENTQAFVILVFW